MRGLCKEEPITKSYYKITGWTLRVSNVDSWCQFIDFKCLRWVHMEIREHHRLAQRGPPHTIVEETQIK